MSDLEQLVSKISIVKISSAKSPSPPPSTPNVQAGACRRQTPAEQSQFSPWPLSTTQMVVDDIMCEDLNYEMELARGKQREI